jgi:uncharacterized membrane protein YsdA (DUF1294 family)
MFPVTYVGLALLAMNGGAFLAFWWDKQLAKAGSWRIRESTLLWLALLGGSVGAISAKQLFRHKTRKEPFRTTLGLIVFLHATGLAIWLLAPDLVAKFVEQLAN